MIFSSYAFIFRFLPVAYLGYRIACRSGNAALVKLWLIAASLYFYAQGSLSHLPILVSTLLVNFWLSRFITADGSARSRMALTASMVLSLWSLFYFKYLNFALEIIAWLLSGTYRNTQTMLPLGISFYTFQILAHNIDLRRGDAEPGSLLDYAVFVTFFPQLIVGPIIRHGDMLKQLRSDELLKTQSKNIQLGILMFAVGCAKKVILADPLIAFAETYYAAVGEGSVFEAWTGVLAYTFAYYFDFSGYIDMALGLGRLFNIELPVNFDSPYKARNFADFWRRWNMTVSRFFNDYVFRSIFHFGDRTPKLIFATLVTFLVSGLWHGAGWNYIVWGLVNGLLVSAANIMTLKRRKLPTWLAWSLTFFCTLMVRVLFDAADLSQALLVYRQLFDFGGVSIASALEFSRANAGTLFFITVGAGICFFAPNLSELSREYEPRWYHAAAAGILMAASLFCMGAVSSFLYFQF